MCFVYLSEDNLWNETCMSCPMHSERKTVDSKSYYWVSYVQNDHLVERSAKKKTIITHTGEGASTRM